MANTSKKPAKRVGKGEERKKLFLLLQKSLTEYSDRLDKKKLDKILEKTSKKLASRLNRGKPRTVKKLKEKVASS